MARITRRLSMLLVLVTLLATTSWVSAQPVRMMEGLEDALQPDFVRRDLATLVQELGIAPEQRPIVDAVFSDYETQFDAAAAEVRQQLNDLRPNMGETDGDLEQRRDELRQRVADLAERMEAIRSTENLSGEEIRAQEAAIAAEAEKVRAELREIQRPALEPSQIRQIMAQGAAILDAWEPRKAALRQEFTDDLLTALNAEQRELWAGVSRRLVREKSLPRGRLSGESVDLHLIVRELRLPTDVTTAANPQLEEYSVRLDAALTARDQQLPKLQRQHLIALQGQDESAASLLARQMQLRVAVRDVNEEFAGRLAEALPEEFAGKFKQDYRSRAYPRVYRSTLVERAINSALELADLTEDQRAAIEGIQTNYQAELARVNEELTAVIRAHEPQETQTRGRARRGREASPQAAEPIPAAFAKRNEMGDRYLEQLKAQLTPEQWSKLPASRREAEAEDADGQPRGAGRDRRGARGQANREAMIRQFDTDGDGVLSEEERAAMRERLRERRQERERNPGDEGSMEP